MKYDLIFVNAYLYVCTSRKMNRNRPPMCLKYGGFKCSINIVAIWQFMALFFSNFLYVWKKSNNKKIERKKTTRIWPGLCVISQGFLIYDKIDHIPTVFKYQVLVVEPLTSVCSNTIGRNFTVPYLISIPPKAYPSMGMQELTPTEGPDRRHLLLNSKWCNNIQRRWRNCLVK